MAAMQAVHGGVWGMVVVLAACSAHAGDHGTAKLPDEPTCGAPGCCGTRLVPVCRRVPVTKKKPKTEYDVKCELVCVPGPGPLCTHKKHGCSEGGCCDDGCCEHMKLRWKKTLVKTTTDKEEDAWEYKVEWVCPGCTGSPGCTAEPCADATPPAKPNLAGLAALLHAWK